MPDVTVSNQIAIYDGDRVCCDEQHAIAAILSA